ncbi:Methionyl-tRNA formyltransferase [Streptomyces sp. RB5]|uniref:Methionyl-tRNA formyltransferase n=1 Tax=Streptomyces smaragdinus TaxID=2585196 RepID=A0A7K0CMP9_9ACTN|nr:formyltransferase family protein [Streptomyces smaragdinus]MQY14758.1 Methionyl-tRNA formyltransferase [Streptomyces smaragdinus]
MTRLVLVSGHTFGRRAYEGLFASAAFLDGRLEVPLMIGLPEERTAGTVGYSSIASLAREQGADYVPASDGSLLSLAGTIRAREPHYLLVVGWSRLIHPDVLSIPGERGGGCIGMHPTRLPLGRGQAPIPWTIIKGLESTALSVFFLEAGADTGPVIAQYELPVRARETAASLFYRVAQTHHTAGHELAEGLADRTVTGTVQDETAASRWPRRRPADGRLEHTMAYREIDALVRALLGPYPRAFAVIDGLAYPVVAARLIPARDHDPKLAEVLPDRVRFGCPEGIAELVREVP